MVSGANHRATGERGEGVSKIDDAIKALWPRRPYRGKKRRTTCQLEVAPHGWTAAVVSMPDKQWGDEDFDVLEVHKHCGHVHQEGSGRMMRCIDRLLNIHRRTTPPTEQANADD